MRATPWRRVAVQTILVAAGLTIAVLSSIGAPGSRTAQRPDPVTDPFKGITTDGSIVPGLFSIRATGVSTEPVREAAVRFLAALTPEQRTGSLFPLDDPEWRMWNNVHRSARQGVSFKEMTADQRELAYGLLGASMSAKGFETSRDIMRLNGYLGELVDSPEEYGEGLYHFTIMGEPSPTDPWGWQLEGHHLIVNYFVLGDQVVMTPTFMGSEPAVATSGRLAGTAVLQAEQHRGLALIHALRPDQLDAAVLGRDKSRNHALAQAYRDNLVLDYSGIRATALDDAQRRLLVSLIAEYVGHMDDGHARVRMEEVLARLDETWFAWIGGIGPDAVFYYRVHSPVILIEFDHQLPVALPGPRVPNPHHVHTVVRTPNGNDYGKDLLRQHYEAHWNDPGHGHREP